LLLLLLLQTREVFTHSAIKGAPISGSGRADKGDGARPLAWAKQWGGARRRARV